jgi:hypothetical protein
MMEFELIALSPLKLLALLVVILLEERCALTLGVKTDNDADLRLLSAWEFFECCRKKREVSDR